MLSKFLEKLNWYHGRKNVQFIKRYKCMLWIQIYMTFFACQFPHTFLSSPKASLATFPSTSKACIPHPKYPVHSYSLSLTCRSTPYASVHNFNVVPTCECSFLPSDFLIQNSIIFKPKENHPGPGIICLFRRSFLSNGYHFTRHKGNNSRIKRLIVE
jgi:hypothetical protein